MSLKKIGWGVVGVAAVVATALIVRRLLVSDRDRVARAVGQLARHLERRDVGSFCLLLAEDYTDSGGHNRSALRSRLTQGLPTLESFSVRFQELEIEVREDEARAEFLAVTVARGRGRQRSWRWETRVRLVFGRREGEWRVVRAEYRLPERLTYLE